MTKQVLKEGVTYDIYTDTGYRLFWVVSVGRKWTHGVWYTQPLKVTRVSNKVTYVWQTPKNPCFFRAIEGDSIPHLQKMARAMYKRQTKMPKSLRKALFHNNIGDTK